MKRNIENIDQKLESIRGSYELQCGDSFTDKIFEKIDAHKSNGNNYKTGLVVLLVLVALNLSSIYIILSNKKNNELKRSNSLQTMIDVYSLNSYSNNMKLQFKGFNTEVKNSRQSE